MRPIRRRVFSARPSSCSAKVVYVHVPFCRSFCTYCGFYSEIASESALNRYADALIAEAEERRNEITDEVPTLYIGGGTPTVLPLSVLRRIVEAIGKGPYEEFTLEANPEDIVEKGEEYAAGLLALGVNRVSMGIQSFDDGVLRKMNRRHNAERAVDGFHILRRAGFRNLSIDLIFGSSWISDSCWEKTLDMAMGLSPEHISCYQLSVDEGSALAEMEAAGRYSALPDELCRKQYDLLCSRLSREGYIHYEISNFARPGFEAVHNSAYWRRVPYVGLGPAAHSFDGSSRRWNSSNPVHWSQSFETLSPEEERLETIMLGLRTAEGLPEQWLRSSVQADVDNFLKEGLLSRSGGNLRIPEDRFFVSDDIIRELV